MKMFSYLLGCWNLRYGIFDKAENTLECLAHFQSVVEKRNTIPILSNIKITALEGGLTLTATDLVMELSESLGASVKTVGGVTISSQLFLKLSEKPR